MPRLFTRQHHLVEGLNKKRKDVLRSHCKTISRFKKRKIRTNMGGVLISVLSFYQYLPSDYAFGNP